MPFAHLRLLGAPEEPRFLPCLQVGLTELIATILAKEARLTAVVVEQVPAGAWAVGGAPIPVSAHLVVTVTAGTNSPQQKATFVAEAAKLLRSELGRSLPQATYVVVDEVPAESWGYDGLTQAARRPKVVDGPSGGPD